MKRLRTNIYRRKYRNGRIVWMVRWWDDKRQGYKAVRAGDTKQEAEFYEARVKNEIMMGMDPTPKVSSTSLETVGQVVDEFYKRPRFQSQSPYRQKTMRCQLDGHVQKYLGSKEMTDLTADDVVHFYMKLKEMKRSHSTIRHYHFTLCLVGDTWTAMHPEFDNPVRKVKDFAKLFSRQAPTRDINFLTPEELEVLFVRTQRSKSKLLHPFIQFLAHTGMRRSEALNLKWTDIDVKGGFLKPLKTAVKRAKIKKRVDIHTLRHTFGSNKIRQGWGLKKVSMILGHADITMTAKVYTHLLDGDLKVRDEFQFDNSTKSENSKKNRMGNAQLSPQEILAMIQTLQTQLIAAIGTPKANLPPSGSTTPSPQMFPQKDLESFGEIQTDSTKNYKTGEICYPGATQMKKNKKGLVPKNQASKNFSNDSRHFPFGKVVSHDGFEPSTLTLKVSTPSCESSAENQKDISERGGDKLCQNSPNLSENFSMIPNAEKTPCVSNVSRSEEFETLNETLERLKIVLTTGGPSMKPT